MYKAYNYTATYGIMNFSDYPYEVKSDHSNCRYDATKVAFKNVGMVQETDLSNEDLKLKVSIQPIAVGIYST